MPVSAAHELVADALRAEVALAAAMQAGNLDRSSAAGESDVSRTRDAVPSTRPCYALSSTRRKAGVGQKLNKGQQMLGGSLHDGAGRHALPRHERDTGRRLGAGGCS